MPQLDDKVDLVGSGDGTSVCVAGGGGSQILAVHSWMFHGYYYHWIVSREYMQAIADG